MPDGTTSPDTKIAQINQHDNVVERYEAQNPPSDLPLTMHDDHVITSYESTTTAETVREDLITSTKDIDSNKSNIIPFSKRGEKRPEEDVATAAD